MWKALTKSFAEAILAPLAGVFVVCGAVFVLFWPVLLAYHFDDGDYPFTIKLLIVCSQLFWWGVMGVACFHAAVELARRQ